MDLDEYLFYEKKKNPCFTYKLFAKRLGVSPHHFGRIIRKQVSPIGVAYNLWKISEGQIDIGKMIIEYFEILKRQGK